MATARAKKRRTAPKGRKITSAKRARSKASASSIGQFVSQSQAKAKWSEYCRAIAGDSSKFYVRDKTGEVFMTVTSTVGAQRLPPLEMTVNTFKQNFARCSSMVKDGFAFHLRLPSGRRVLARRHSSYRNPIDGYLEAWFERLSEAEATKEIVAAASSGNVEVKEALEKVMKGMARISIGHRPFNEGQIDDWDSRPPAGQE